MSFPWGLLVLVVFPLLQLPVIVYLVRRMDRDDPPSPPSPPSMYGHVHPDDPDPAGSPAASGEPAPPEVPARSRATCRKCGTDNDPAFRYCRDCAGRL